MRDDMQLWLFALLFLILLGVVVVYFGPTLIELGIIKPN